MRISDWSSDVCSSDLASPSARGRDARLRDGGSPARLSRSQNGTHRHQGGPRTSFPSFCRIRKRDRSAGAGNLCGGGNAVHHREPQAAWRCAVRSEEHTSELQSLMRISYAVFCLKKKKKHNKTKHDTQR